MIFERPNSPRRPFSSASSVECPTFACFASADWLRPSVLRRAAICSPIEDSISIYPIYKVLFCIRRKILVYKASRAKNSGLEATIDTGAGRCITQTRGACLPLSKPQLLHVGAEARAVIRAWAEEEGVSVNAIVVSVLDEFFKWLKKSKALREGLRLEIRAHRGFMPS